MMEDVENDPQIVEFPSDVADGRAAVILGLALGADVAGAEERDNLEARNVFRPGARGSTHA